MKFLQSLLILIFITNCAIANDIVTTPIEKVKYPLEVKNEVLSTVPKEIEGLQWNRWTSKNFTVLSLDDVQAEYLNKHLEQIKTWILERWGFVDIDFSTECKIICVNDPVLFEKLFKLKSTRVEIRRDSDGKIKESIIFLLVNDSPSHTVPIPLTEVAIAEFELKYNMVFGWWVHRGFSILNGSLNQIRAEIKLLQPKLDNNEPLYFSESCLTMTKEQYAVLSDDDKMLYDKSAFCFCLMLRKEFGQATLQRFIKTSAEKSGLVALQEVLRFRDYDHFDKTFKRYLVDLTQDILSGETPDDYLQIRSKNSDEID